MDHKVVIMVNQQTSNTVTVIQFLTRTHAHAYKHAHIDSYLGAASACLLSEVPLYSRKSSQGIRFVH